MEELEPCPYCGCETVAMHGGADNSTMMYWVSCLGCGARGGRAFSKDDAAKKWNRRAAPENKALTLEDGFDITNADGTPVDYDALGQKYKDRLCYCDIDGFYIGQNGELVLMDDCGKAVSIDRGDYRVEAYKPEK